MTQRKYRTLRYRETELMHGRDVSMLQRVLGVPVDGFYGKQTAGAVRVWRWKAGAPGDLSAIGGAGQRILLKLDPVPLDWQRRAAVRAKSTPQSGVVYAELPPLLYLPTGNQSSRHGTAIQGAVCHETEGGYLGAVSWLRNPVSDASAAGVLREDGGHFTQLVAWSSKAWHAANANPHTLGLELAGFTSKENKIEQLRVAARIFAFWGHRYQFDAEKQANRYGFGGTCRHVDLGSFGGGHHDPGGFNWEWFLRQIGLEVRRGEFPATWGVS